MNTQKIGTKFGILTVVEYSHHKIRPSGQKVACFNCQCECGSIIIVEDSDLTPSAIKKHPNKGCKECRKKLMSLKISKHGMTKTGEYRSWEAMKARCTNKNHESYYLYGGKDIKICDRWINSFENFFDDMGLKPAKSYSVERFDNDKDYEPSNCKWGTKMEQAFNRKTTIAMTFNGITDSLMGWYRRLNTEVSYTTFVRHIKTGQKQLSDFNI